MLLYYNTIIQYDCMTNIGAMAKVLTSLQRQNLHKQVVRRIGLSIMRNDFKPGDALLSEPELSLQFNVNLSVLREALKMLGAKGSSNLALKPAHEYVQGPNGISLILTFSPGTARLNQTGRFSRLTTRSASCLSL